MLKKYAIMALIAIVSVAVVKKLPVIGEYL